MSFLCVPIIFGFSQSFDTNAGQAPRVCPRCNNAAVFPAKKKTKFDLCFIPLFPLSSKQVWVCTICQWRIPVQQGWEPAFPQQGPPPGQWNQPAPGQWQHGPPPAVFQQGYNPSYTPSPPQGQPPNK